jgi:hypothetical protein
MKITRTVLYIILSICLLLVGGVWILKQYLKKAQPENAPAITQKEQSPIDLRPAAIAKLQQLVEAGSDSLYQLGIDSLLTEVATGTIILKGVSVQPDSNMIGLMRQQQRLPDDVYSITLKSLRITGIGLADLVNRRDLSLQSIVCVGPQITLQHKLQPYNAAKRAAANQGTLFSKLQGQIDRLAIDSISITKGNLTDKSGGTTNTYKDVSISLRDVLLDSTAEQDPTRFLFAKVSLLQAGTITMPSGKGKYDFSIGGIAISGEKQEVRIQDLTMKPHGGKAEFMKYQEHQVEVYDLRMPVITLRGVDWWAAAHGESLIAKEAELTNANVYIYLDQRLPGSGKMKRDNFPQQMLVDMKMPLSLKTFKLKNANLIYEELTKASGKQSRITFNKMNGVAEGFTNLSAEVAARPEARFKGSCQFMNASEMAGTFTFALPRKKRGAFTANLSIGPMAAETVNPFGEAMGLLRIKTGQLQYAKAQVEGNNDHLQGTLTAAYTNLHIMPLKPAKEEGEALRKKRVIGKIANVLLVKDNNPQKGGELRTLPFERQRTTEGNFFNFIWMGIRDGMLKTIGVPPSLGG